jgi:hypothetical protein
LNNAINKYGADNFKIEILLVINDECLDLYETKFIEIYDTYYPSGYNLTRGGHSNHNYSDASRLKMSTTQKALYQNSEKMREHIKNNGGWSKPDKSLPMYLSTYRSKNKTYVHSKLNPKIVCIFQKKMI